MKQLTVDLETTSLSPDEGKIVCCGYKFNDEGVKVCFDKLPQLLIDALKSSEYEKIFHNAPFELGWFKKYGIEVAPPIFDTKLVLHSKNPFESLRLKDVLERLGWKVSRLNQLLKIKNKKILITDLDKSVLENYNKQDVEGTYYLWTRLKDCLSFWTETIEHPLVWVVVDMESRGFYIDQNLAKQLELQFCKQIVDIEGQFAINLSSPKQLIEHFTKAGFRKELEVFKTKKGQPSINKLTIKSLAYKIPEFYSLAKHRELSKLTSTYVSVLKTTPVLKGHFNQVGTRTGRFSSSNPNLQNIPNRSENGKLVRSCFMAHPEHKLIVGDLAQIEPRILAHFTRDPKLVTIFNSGEDFHSNITRTLFGETFSKEQRFIGKQIGLAIFYGAQPKRLKETLLSYGVDITFSDAFNMRNKAEEEYRDAFLWTKKYEYCVRKNGYLQTLLGRRVPYQEGMNTLNFLIQASQSDIIKVIMLNLYNNGLKLVGMVHDEVIIESRVPERDFEVLTHFMKNSVRLRVPIEAEIKICDRWSEK